MAITMEELRQKAKAYDKVREKIALRFGSNVAEEIFSEYEMSEDERIRKDIISYLRSEKIVKRYISDIEFDKWIAWLEKQVPIDEDEIVEGIRRGVAISLMNHIDANSKEMCLSNMECEDIENAIINEDWDKVYRYMKKKLEKQEVTKISDQEEGFIEIPFGAYDSELIEDTYFIPEGCHAVIVGNEVVIKKGERKPAWSEEDEQMIKKLKSCVYAVDLTIEGKNELIAWLESLKQIIGG